jgi:ribosomal-protein-alanine N-acetyltransferase
VEQNLFREIAIESGRIRIRPFSMDDAEDLHAIVSQEKVVEFLPEDVMSKEETKRILGWLIDCYDRNSPERIRKFTTAVVLRETNKLIGWCGLGPLDFEESETELYFGISTEHWGKGIATEAGALMLDYGFRRLGLDRIVAVVQAENLASKRVVEKLGMGYRKTVSGLAPEHAFYEGSLYFDLTATQHEDRAKGAQP